MEIVKTSATKSRKPRIKRKSQPTSLTREQMIAEAAYYRAINLEDGENNPEVNWYEAEKEIDKMIDA